MANNPDVRLSKFISLVLRHKPEEIGLVLDAEGWASVEELIKKAAQHKMVFTKADLERVVEENDKRRFSFDEAGKKIRANQGHSIAVELDLEVLEPPDKLYHGTATRFLDSIYAQGLKPMNRHDVHMTADHATAIATGSRHGKPVVFTIDAKQMHSDGFTFKRSVNGVWLTANVPPKYLTL